MKSARAALIVIAAPALGLLPASAFTEDGAKGLFQADLVALVIATACGAFLVRLRLRSLLALVAGAGFAGCAHAIVAGFAGAPLLALLALAVSLAAAGLAALGRAVGTPALTAGALGASVLWVAMTGLFWADPVAGTLGRGERFPFRQAVIHLDPATACAYDVAKFDRFHDPRIYREVELAASTIRQPSAGPTGLAWLVVGLLALGMAGWLGRHDEAV